MKAVVPSLVNDMIAAGVAIIVTVVVSSDVATAADKVGGEWGTLKGKIVFTGKIPVLPPLVRKGDKKATDAKVCAAHDVPDESFVVDSKTLGVANVFVYLRRIYGQNGLNGIQTVSIPLSQFHDGGNYLDPNQAVGTLHTRFWYSGPFTVDITSVQACGPAPDGNMDTYHFHFSYGPVNAHCTFSTDRFSDADGDTDVHSYSNKHQYAHTTDSNVDHPLYTNNGSPHSNATSGGIQATLTTLALVGQQWRSRVVPVDQPQCPTKGKTACGSATTFTGCLLWVGKDASAVIIDQNGWRYASLSDYGQNGLNGIQTVNIPLSQFHDGGNYLDPNQAVGTLHTRFWFSGPFTVDIYSILVYASSAQLAPTFTPTPTATTTPSTTFNPSPTATWIQITPTLPPTLNALPPCPSGRGPKQYSRGEVMIQPTGLKTNASGCSTSSVIRVPLRGGHGVASRAASTMAAGHRISLLWFVHGETLVPAEFDPVAMPQRA